MHLFTFMIVKLYILDWSTVHQVESGVSVYLEGESLMLLDVNL